MGEVLLSDPTLRLAKPASAESFPEHALVPEEDLPEGYKSGFDEVVLAIERDCNFDCPDCVMYHLNSAENLRHNPSRIMSDEVIDQVGARMAEHMESEGIREMRVYLFGGEPTLPLLKDPEYLSRLTNKIRSHTGEEGVTFAITTNGTLLEKEIDGKPVLDIIADAGISNITVSIDGDPDTHNQRRSYRNGRPSDEVVRRAIDTMVRWKKKNGSDINLLTLTVMNSNSNPYKVYDTLSSLGDGFSGLSHDLLFPYANYDNPPPEYREHDGKGLDEWLIPIYNRWRRAGSEERRNIKIFNAMLELAKGADNASFESVGPKGSQILVIEPDGTVSGNNSLRLLPDGASLLTRDHASGELRRFNVSKDSFDTIVRHPKVTEMALGREGLSVACRECDEVEVCGGGLKVTRYAHDPSKPYGERFRHPSVYCDDYYGVTSHIDGRLGAEIARYDLAKRLIEDPAADLDAAELRTLYELDRNYGLGPQPGFDAVRAFRAENDRAELGRVLPEAIREQMGSAARAYQEIASQLADAYRPVSSAELQKLFSAKDQEWHATGVYDYLLERLVKDDVRHTLIVTPNIQIDARQVEAMAASFGGRQPLESLISGLGMFRDREAISGTTDPLLDASSSDRRLINRMLVQEFQKEHGVDLTKAKSLPVRFSLIPSGSDPTLDHRPLQEQLEIIEARQARQPFMRFRVPSLFDALAYARTLRAQRGSLEGTEGLRKETYIRHIDLRPDPSLSTRWTEKNTQTPTTYVNDAGEARIMVHGPYSDINRIKLALG